MNREKMMKAQRAYTEWMEDLADEAANMAFKPKESVDYNALGERVAHDWDAALKQLKANSN